MVDVTITNHVGGGAPNTNPQTFTFADGQVDRVNSRTSASPDADPLPLSSPGMAIIFDLNGALKQITISGKLFETTATRVTSAGTAPEVKTILEQKLWLETLLMGNQTPVEFNSNYDKYTFAGDGASESEVNAFVNESGTQTYAVVLELSFEEIEGEPNTMPFTMRLIAGAQ